MKLLKNLFNITLMLLPGLTIDKNFVQVGLTEVIKKVLQGIIDVLLKDAQTVDQSKQ